MRLVSVGGNHYLVQVHVIACQCEIQFLRGIMLYGNLLFLCLVSNHLHYDGECALRQVLQEVVPRVVRRGYDSGAFELNGHERQVLSTAFVDYVTIHVGIRVLFDSHRQHITRYRLVVFGCFSHK